MIDKCPICNGCGLVPGGFYNSLQGHITEWIAGSSSEICRACNGVGIITQYRIDGEGQKVSLKPIDTSDKEDSLTVLKEIRVHLVTIIEEIQRIARNV
jgi:hypothetical protein